jgi:hypothetical protein
VQLVSLQDIIRSRLFDGEDLNPLVLLPNCARKVALPKAGLGYLCARFRRVRCFPGGVVGTMHVRITMTE